MIRRTLAPRRKAAVEIEQAVDYYTDAAGGAVAYRFIEALEAAYGLILYNPGAGSSALDTAVGLPQLRTWNLRGFPYVICYQEQSGRIEIIRVLHAQRDLPNEFSSNRD